MTVRALLTDQCVAWTGLAFPGAVLESSELSSATR